MLQGGCSPACGTRRVWRRLRPPFSAHPRLGFFMVKPPGGDLVTEGRVFLFRKTECCGSVSRCEPQDEAIRSVVSCPEPGRPCGRGPGDEKIAPQLARNPLKNHVSVERIQVKPRHSKCPGAGFSRSPEDAPRAVEENPNCRLRSRSRARRLRQRRGEPRLVIGPRPARAAPAFAACGRASPRVAGSIAVRARRRRARRRRGRRVGPRPKLRSGTRPVRGP